MDNAGRTEERYQSEIEGIEDVVVSLQGVKAWVSAHHFEVLVPKNVLIEVLNQMLPGGWSDQLMGRMVEMDDRMDALGYLRLTTYPQTMRLLGNVIDDEVSELARRDGIIAASATSNAKPGKRAGLWQNRFVRASIQKLINKLYQLLHQDGRSS